VKGEEKHRPEKKFMGCSLISNRIVVIRNMRKRKRNGDNGANN